jgi:NADH dehydrogenase
MENLSPARILVLGGGFGGVHTAMELEKRLPSNSNTQITLVSQTNFFLFTPMLHEVAASDLDITHIVSPLRTLLKRTHILIGDVDAIDLAARRVRVRHGRERHVHTLEYDQIVIALGSITNFYGLPGLERHALTMKSLGDAIELRNRVIATLEEADNECASGDDGLLTFVVAGGGFAGVETIAAVNDFVRESLSFYRGIDPARVRMVLVHAGPVLLPELGPELGGYAQNKLGERGVEIHINAKVRDVDAARVLLSDGTHIQARLVVWTAGTSPHPLLHELPCALDRGRIHVDETLRVPGFPGVWALGDCAVVPDRRTGGTHPPTAQHALREARTAARNIVATLGGAPCVPFAFRTVGQLAAIGRRTGVARIFGFNFSGFFAWWLWRTIYLGKLPRLEKKVRVAIDWTLDLIFTKDFVQFLAVRAQALPDLPDRPSEPISEAVLMETTR